MTCLWMDTKDIWNVLYCIALYCIVMFWLSFHFLAHALPRPLWSPLCTLKVSQYVSSSHHHHNFPLFVHLRFNNLSDAITFYILKTFPPSFTFTFGWEIVIFHLKLGINIPLRVPFFQHFPVWAAKHFWKHEQDESLQ